FQKLGQDFIAESSNKINWAELSFNGNIPFKTLYNFSDKYITCIDENENNGIFVGYNNYKDIELNRTFYVKMEDNVIYRKTILELSEDKKTIIVDKDI